MIVVFLDLKRSLIPFITNCYFKKLYQYGVRGNVFTWYESFLTNRSHYVLFNGNKSDIRDVTCGVPHVLFSVIYYSLSI